MLTFRLPEKQNHETKKPNYCRDDADIYEFGKTLGRLWMLGLRNLGLETLALALWYVALGKSLNLSGLEVLYL